MAYLVRSLQVKTNMRMLADMKFLRFIFKPHRFLALFLGVSFLMFTQFVVFKSFDPLKTKEALYSTEKGTPVIKKAEQKGDSDFFEIQDVYFGDLIDALEEMTEDNFSGLKNIEVHLESPPKIAIVIDDVGMNKIQSWNAVNLDFPVTLSFLPYATDIQEMADHATEKGHDIMLHIPMQPLGQDVNAGENALEIDLSETLLKERLDKNLSALDSYVGINNHMGSAFTQDEKGMNVLMASLKGKGVFFLDSRTTAESVGKETASRYNVPFLERHVFLDHEETYEFTATSLEKLESIAQEGGVAIAIGHPKDITLKSLTAWAKKAQEKGFELVPLSDLIAR